MGPYVCVFVRFCVCPRLCLRTQLLACTCLQPTSVCVLAVLDRCIPIDNLVDAAEAVIDVGGEPVVDNDNNTVTGTDLDIATE